MMSRAWIGSVALAILATGCLTSEDELQYEEDDGGKADAVRPYGAFAREVATGEHGFASMKILQNPAKTYRATRRLANCSSSCIQDIHGTYKFGSMANRPHIVLFDERGREPLYTLEYALTGAELDLREHPQPEWVGLDKRFEGLMLTDADNGRAFEMTEGDDIFVKLPATSDSGYAWKVASSTIGSPPGTFEPSSTTSTSGTTTFRWITSGVSSKVGRQSIQLAYVRSGEVARTFAFTVDVRPLW